jgi:hypothetical protein
MPEFFNKEIIILNDDSLLSSRARWLVHGGSLLVAGAAVVFYFFTAASGNHEPPEPPEPEFVEPAEFIGSSEPGSGEPGFGDPGLGGFSEPAVPPATLLPTPERPSSDFNTQNQKRTTTRALSRDMKLAGRWLSRQYRISAVAIEPALRAAEDVGQQFNIDPLLLVAMMAIESSFNPFAESTVGAQGLMQVIPRYHQEKIGQGASENALFDPEFNVRIGAQVLREGLQRYGGDLQTALQYYGGALNDTEAAYANRVLTMKQRLVDAVRANGAI